MPIPESSTPRSDELLHRQRSRLLLVDMQERLMAAMPDGSGLVNAAALLGDAARLFEIPIDLTEQYPQGLGRSVPEVAKFTDRPAEKVCFSAAEALGVTGASDSAAERDQFVIAGVETHVCVLQTAFDLMSLGYRVFVVADAVGSRRTNDRDRALERLRDGGAVITTAEAVAFEWCASAADPQFKALSALIKSRGGIGQ